MLVSLYPTLWSHAMEFALCCPQRGVGLAMMLKVGVNTRRGLFFSDAKEGVYCRHKLQSNLKAITHVGGVAAFLATDSTVSVIRAFSQLHTQAC